MYGGSANKCWSKGSSIQCKHAGFILNMHLQHIYTLSVCLSVCVTVEWSVFVLKVLSELSPVLLVQDANDDTEENEEKTNERRQRGEAEGKDNGETCSQVLSLFTKCLLSRFDCLTVLSLTVSLDFSLILYLLSVGRQM